MASDAGRWLCTAPRRGTSAQGSRFVEGNLFFDNLARRISLRRDWRLGCKINLQLFPSHLLQYTQLIPIYLTIYKVDSSGRNKQVLKQKDLPRSETGFKEKGSHIYWRMKFLDLLIFLFEYKVSSTLSISIIDKYTDLHLKTWVLKLKKQLYKIRNHIKYDQHRFRKMKHRKSLRNVI